MQSSSALVFGMLFLAYVEFPTKHVYYTILNLALSSYSGELLQPLCQICFGCMSNSSSCMLTLVVLCNMHEPSFLHSQEGVLVRVGTTGHKQRRRPNQILRQE